MLMWPGSEFTEGNLKRKRTFRFKLKHLPSKEEIHQTREDLRTKVTESLIKYHEEVPSSELELWIPRFIMSMPKNPKILHVEMLYQIDESKINSHASLRNLFIFLYEIDQSWEVLEMNGRSKELWQKGAPWLFLPIDD